MENVAYLLLIILTIINFIIYHKIFRVYYFDLGRGLLKEILGCFIVALIEYGILVLIGKVVFKVLIVIAILFGAFLIYKKVKGERIDAKIKRLFVICLCCLGVVCIPYIANFSFEDDESNRDEVENYDYNYENNISSEVYEEDYIEVSSSEENNKTVEDNVFDSLASTPETIYEAVEEEQAQSYLYNNFSNDTTNEYDVTIIVEYINDEDGFITFLKADRNDENINEEIYEFSFSQNGAVISDIRGNSIECYFEMYDNSIDITDMKTWNVYTYDEVNALVENVEDSEDIEITEKEVTEPTMPSSLKFASWDDETEYVVYVYFNYDYSGGRFRIDKTTHRGGGASSICEYFEYVFVPDEETEGIYHIHDEYTGYQNMYFEIVSEECFKLNIYDEKRGTVKTYLETEYAYNNVG